ncbi:hypothetical protein JVT61DRAFT_3713 [Boletus reticuloceps]|uniref:Uncharacterized protein n=1 Tax=Boletus reticuloceps TaxID=495285 RepID=A0A8I2YNX7_9AGAM|nr:hypothetical protein JVT61DRAFT_3713 [Boletus reticuloceps]
MLLEGEHKVLKPWKPGQKIQVQRDVNVGDGMSSVAYKELDVLTLFAISDVYLKKQLNLKVIVMDKAIKARWMEKLNIPVIAGKDIYHTTTLLNYHTGYWGPTTASSELRSHKETISTAISEYCTILDYCVPLLSQDGSTAAFICCAFENATSFAVQLDKGHQGPTSRLLTWPDSIKFNAESASALLFNIVTNNTCSLRIASRLHDQAAIQKVINAVGRAVR